LLFAKRENSAIRRKQYRHQAGEEEKLHVPYGNPTTTLMLNAAPPGGGATTRIPVSYPVPHS